MSEIKFNLTLHIHQPIGNFDHVMARAIDLAYMPFLDVLAAHPGIKVNLHVSGCLLEWMEENRSDYLDRVRVLVEGGQIELFGGGFYEPIFTMLPECDRQGQIEMYRDYLREHFDDVSAGFQGYWLTERVWEQSLVQSLFDAGIRYTLCDDTHFFYAGVSERELDGYYLTEDQGRVMAVFPIPEFLRYAIPFKDPQDTIAYLRTFKGDGRTPLLVYGDDGEKFGMWPETNEHVYGDGWLERFFSALGEADDIELVFLSEAFEKLPPRGRVFLPDASYREMTEWALPAREIRNLVQLENELKSRPDGAALRRFVRGGSWRNFRVKYPEANRLYSRMMHLSKELAELDSDDPAVAEARRELYRSQCNCAYWHGIFGGLYLPHLRDRVARAMIDCEVKLAGIRYATDQWIRVEASDLDCDGAEEIYLANAAVSACLAPDSGGTLYEFNAKETSYPLLNTLARRYEAYHDRVHELSRAGEEEKVASIHDRVRAKQDKLETLLVYDSNKRTSLIDRFLRSDATVQTLQDNSAQEQGDFVGRPYEIEQIEARVNVQVVLGRTSLVQSEQGEMLPINVSKTITMLREHAGLSVDVTITNSGAEQLSTRYAQEWNFSMLAGEAPDRYYLADGEMCGNLSTVMMRSAGVFSLVDEWRRTAVRLTPGRDVEFWTYPVKTVSQSEDGFEGLYQCSAVIVTFPIKLEPGARETFHIDLDVEVLEKKND